MALMPLIRLTCLVLATILIKISESRCFGRNGHGNSAAGGGLSRAYLPVVLTDQLPPYHDISPTGPTITPPCPATVPDESSTHTVLTNDDLKALLLLASVLESDKTACTNKGIDVDRLLETLVTALVYTTTHTVETSMNRCNTPVQNDANNLCLLNGQNGLIDKLLSAIIGGQSCNANGGDVRHTVQSTTGSLAQGSQNGQSLVGLNLGQNGLKLNVGDLVDANVGGSRSATGEPGSHNGQGLVDLNLGKNGLDLNVGGIIDANVGGNRPATGEPGSHNGQGLVDLNLGKNGLDLNVGGIIDANVGGNRPATGEPGNHNGKGLVDLNLGRNGLNLDIGGIIDANVGGNRSATGASETTTATSSVSSEATTSTTTKTNGHLVDKVLDGVAVKDGLLENVL